MLEKRAKIYKVESADGREFFGYVHRVSANPYTLAVFKMAFRRVTANMGPSDYERENPGWKLDYTDLVAVVVNPPVVLPRAEDAAEVLPYGLTKNGTWWQKVKVPYITVNSESATEEIP